MTDTAGGKDAGAGAGEDPRLTKLLSEVRASIVGHEQGDEVKEISATVEGAFRKYWESPPTEQMEIALRKRMVLEEARQILFFPTEGDMAYYCTLILSAPADSPKDHPTSKLQPIAVPLLYLVHSKKWPLARALMLADGLHALVTLFTAENLYLRSQAIETFSRLTSKEVHMDWMEVGDGNAAVRDKLFQLSRSCDIIRACIANMRGSYPDGGYSCLRNLAFWLSWVRAIYCPDKRLRVSQKVLDALSEWSTCEEASCDEERELARMLHEDFNRLPAADANQAQGGAASSGMALEGAKDKTRDDVRKDGNELLKEGKIAAAVECYTRAIEMGKPGESDCASFLNRALARLKLAPPDNEGAVIDCDAAIDGGYDENPKAFYRKAIALESMGRLEAAAIAATKAKKLAVGDTGVAEVCSRIEAKLKEQRDKARKEKMEREREERRLREKERDAEKLRKAHDVDELD